MNGERFSVFAMQNIFGIKFHINTNVFLSQDSPAQMTVEGHIIKTDQPLSSAYAYHKPLSTQNFDPPSPTPSLIGLTLIEI